MVLFLHVRSAILHEGTWTLTGPPNNFVALFWAPLALAHSFPSAATYPRCLFAIHSTKLHGGSTKQVSKLYSRRPFLGPRTLPNSTHAAPIGALLIPTYRILPYSDQSRRLTSSTHYHIQHFRSTFTVLQDGGVLTTCCRILSSLRNKRTEPQSRTPIAME